MMMNDAVDEEANVELMESEVECQTVELTSFTESIRSKHVPLAIKVLPKLESALEKHGLSVTLNQAAKSSITVSTTTRTRDPNIIDTAKDCITLIFQTSAPPIVAIRALNGEFLLQIIKIGFQEGGLAATHGIEKDRFKKRAARFFQHSEDYARYLGTRIYPGADCIAVTAYEAIILRTTRGIVKMCIADNRDPGRLLRKLLVLDMDSTLKGIKL